MQYLLVEYDAQTRWVYFYLQRIWKFCLLIFAVTCNKSLLMLEVIIWIRVLLPSGFFMPDSEKATRYTQNRKVPKN
jgi:hypothetical protein